MMDRFPAADSGMYTVIVMKLLSLLYTLVTN